MADASLRVERKNSNRSASLVLRHAFTESGSPDLYKSYLVHVHCFHI